MGTTFKTGDFDTQKVFSFLLIASLFCTGLRADNDSGPLPRKAALSEFDATLKMVESERARLFAEWKKSKEAKKKEVFAEARKFVENALLNRIFPAWYKMPWTMAVINDGLKPNASRPYAHPVKEGKGVSCSWFVVRTLQNAGFKFTSASKFAGTIAVHFQNSLTPNKKHFHRLWKISPEQLHQKMVELGDGLYVIGLNCHIGFVSVQGDKVDFIHSSYVHPNEVIREKLTESDPIAFSEDTGYVVTALFKDNYLLSHWLSGQKIPFKKGR